jgi:23S rRNA pseudouridine1911/1915/1917 synthase
MVVAKTEGALTYLQAAFKRRDVEKRYSALVHGKPPPKGTFDTSYARHAKDRKRFTSKVKEGKRALTHYTVAESLPGPVTLVDIKLETGRTHQIRVHFSDAGFPLVHDVMYGGVTREAKQKSDLLTEASAAIGRQALHARVLSFPHPKTAEVLRFEAPLPADFQAAIDRLRRG